MIRRAVEQRPDDGYIVDSLGWAYYRLGNYDEAVKHLERAVELKPDDPTINDHLGDAYWKIGRVLEAQFQWSHARDLKPEPEELVKIKQKLATGLTEETSSADAARRSPTAAERLNAAISRSPAYRPGIGVLPGWRQARAARIESRMAALVEHAPAKVNLTLAVLGRRADGYHLLDSLVVFAGAGDRLTFAPGGALSLEVRGATADAAGPIDDNLVFKAAHGAGGRNAGSQARPLHARQAPAGGGGLRRRLVRCRGGAAAAGARQPPQARRSAAAQGRARRSAPTCRSASIRGRGGCAASAKSCRRRLRCRSSRRCWSIRASRCRPRTCSRCSASQAGRQAQARRHGRQRCRATATA